MDVLEDVLGSLRLNGGVILEGHAKGDWCVSSQFQREDVAELFPGGGPLIAYHYIQSGRVFAQVDGHPAVVAPAGSIIMFPRNDRHRLYTAPEDQPVDSHAFVLAGAEGRPARFEIGEDGEEAEFFCGFLGVENADHPLLDCLPPLLLIDDVTAAQEDWLESNLKFLRNGRQSPETVARIAELMFAHAVRAYVADLEPGEGGWLRALKDNHVARALRVIHARYAEDLDVETIAREAGVSRSVLGERFVELLGEPPMRYCAKWRMRVAANMLRDGKENSANIAYAVGFNSEAAFNRAFKREYGEPPITWKRRLAEQEARRDAPEDEPEARVAIARRSERTGTCISKDGTCIGYSELGEGFPLLMPAVWYHQVQSDWSSPVWRHWIAEAIKSQRLIRSDIRGTGMSERNPSRWSFDALLEDFEAVVDDLEIERFDVLAFSHASLVAIAYAARHPERVRKMALIGGYARGYGARGDQEEVKRREGLIEFARNYKSAGGGGTFAQMLGALYWPAARGETVDWFGQRLGVIMDLDEAIMEVFRSTDLSPELASIKADTLIMHSKGDRIINCKCSEEIAEAIPHARFIPIESDNHVVIGTEPAWETARRAFRTLLDTTDEQGLAGLPRARSMLPERRFMTASDGAKIAYESIGDGFPLVKAPTWITHLDLDDESPVYRHWVAECSRDHRFVHSDMRGFGLSQWDPPQLDFEAICRDFGEMIDDAGIGQCDLLGISHGAAVAIDYAARHPERVRKLVIVNGFAAGWRVRADPEEIAWRKSLMEMNQLEWAFRRSKFGEMYLTLYFPNASEEVIRWHNDHFEDFGPVPNLQRMIEIAADIDVRDQLAQIKAETLVCHARQDGNAVVEVGRQVAGAIPNARFVELDSANHLLLGDEPAWPIFTRQLRAFLKSAD